jgi:WD40 repeat protein
MNRFPSLFLILAAMCLVRVSPCLGDMPPSAPGVVLASTQTPILSACLAAGGAQLILGCRDGRILTVDVHSGGVQLIGNEPRPVSSVTASSDGSLIADAGGETVSIRDATTGKLVRSLAISVPGAGLAQFLPGRHEISVVSIAHSAGEKTPSYAIQVCNAENGSQVWTAALDDRPEAMSCSADGSRIVVGLPGEVYVFDAKTGKSVSHDLDGDPVEAVAFAPDSASVAIGTFNARYWIMPPTLDSFINNWADGNTVASLAYSPDGSLLANGSIGIGQIRLWNVRTGKVAAHFGTGFATVGILLFSPDGKEIYAVETTPKGSQVRKFEAPQGVLQG